jgi:hypothetical protein
MDGPERQASFSFQCTSSWFESFEPLEKKNKKKKFLSRTKSNEQHKILLCFFPYILFQKKLICEQKIKQLREIFSKKFYLGGDREIFDFLEDFAPLIHGVIFSNGIATRNISTLLEIYSLFQKKKLDPFG